MFQVCCNDCRPRTSFFAPAPCPEPCPHRRAPSRRPGCPTSSAATTSPCTELKRETYYTPVEEQVKSYYYEPVCSYRYSCYYDPCTGCPQQIATPVTSYRLREKCNTVTRWIETVPDGADDDLPGGDDAPAGRHLLLPAAGVVVVALHPG